MTSLALSGTKRALLDRLLQEKGLAAASVAAITRSQQTDPAPLSFGQQRMWFLQQLDPGSHLYNIAAALKMEGVLDVAALEKSINEIVRRHESLRTVFRTMDGRLVQVVNPPFHLDLAPVPVEGASVEIVNEEVARHAAKEGRRLFDLINGPLLRAKLLRINEYEHFLLLCMHHIISDGWSVAILLHELATLYNAYCEGRRLQLPELPIRYQDFARWQRHENRQDELAIQLQYWKDQLNGIPPVLKLPTDHPRSPGAAFRGSAVPVLIPRDLAGALSGIARAEGATLFMVLATAFSILLFRYSGQQDFALGTPVAGRNRPEIEDLIGFFVNTLVLRARLSGELTFRELLREMKEVCLGAYAHQDVPFERLVEELHPERYLGQSPLFQVMLDLQNAAMPPANFHGLRTTLLPIATDTAKFDLTLTLYETDAGLDGAMEYSTELFEDATLRRMTENFRSLLGGIAAHADTKISLLPILSEAEKTTLLVEWNGARCDAGNRLPIIRLFERQVEKSPDQTAAVCAGESLLYRELNQRANRLANYLRACGTGPEMLTGICLERSLGMVIAVLAVLKAGGAYVPLDPAYPRERLNSMIKGAALNLLLTETRFLKQLPQAAVPIICLDSESGEIAACAPDNPDFDALPENPAYVIYTSGSTGRPKGVVISYGSLAHSTYSRIAYYDEPVRAFLLLPSFSFDSSVAGLFWTLCRGGKLVIPREESHHDPVYLASLIEEHSVSHLLCVPSLYHLLLENEPERLASLHTAIVAGEVCPPGVVRRHRELLPHACLFNEYGPTEATVWSSVFDCSSAVPGNSVPIGRPITNAQIYLLDRSLQPVPMGAVGEVFIGGAGVGRGYLSDPGLTAGRFVPDPLGNAPGSRLYRTGDLARYLPTGNLEFLGRNDSQVKIRGYRIELGEIETALSDHPAVHQAAVVAGERGLTCYVALQQRRGATAKDLRNHLGAKLPGYMIPSWFEFLDSLPLTPSGKVDRKALSLRLPQEFERSSPYVAPRTALEEVLAGIFAAVLGRQRVGIEDNFFEAGGHSLLATQAVSRIREALQLELPLRRIFEEPTAAGLAAAILATAGESRRVTRTAELLLALSGVSDQEAAALMEQRAVQAPREDVS